MATTTDKSESFGLFDNDQFVPSIKREPDGEVLYLNLSDLIKECNSFYCADSVDDSRRYIHFDSQQLPSIELLLQTAPSSIDCDYYPSQCTKRGQLDQLIDSESSSKLCSTDSDSPLDNNFIDGNCIFTSPSSSSSVPSSTASSPSEVSTTTPSINQLTIHDDCYNPNGDYFYYDEGYKGRQSVIESVHRVHCDQTINSDDDYPQSQRIVNRDIIYPQHHQPHRQFVSPSDCDSFLSASTTIEASPRKGKGRYRSKKVCKKYSKKKNLSQDELERKRDLANQQERTRMHRLNSALKHLRSHIPPEFSRHPKEKNLSKIKTLRIAIEYIRELTNILNVDNPL